MSKKLAGKVVVITGTGGSIGREAALLFAREGALNVGCGLGVEDASAIADLEAYGQMVLANPDFVERLRFGVTRYATPAITSPSAVTGMTNSTTPNSSWCAST